MSASHPEQDSTSQLWSMAGIVQKHLPKHSAICGGWVLDMSLGMGQRPHKDIDISVQRRYQLDVQTYFLDRGWTLEIAHDGELSPWEKGTYLELPYHTIWCKNAQHTPDFVELQLDEGDETHYLFRRDSSIKLEWSRAIRCTPVGGMPYLASEIVLLYKAKYPDEANNQFDFETLSTGLSNQQRAWLRDGINKLHPGHPWLDRL